MDSSEGVACPLRVTLLTDYGTPTWTIPADHKDHREIVYLLNFHSRMRGEAQYYDTGVSDSHEGYRGFAVEKIQGDPAAANTAPQTQVTVSPRAHNRLQHLLVESAPSLDQKVHQLVKRAANTYTSGREFMTFGMDISEYKIYTNSSYTSNNSYTSRTPPPEGMKEVK